MGTGGGGGGVSSPWRAWPGRRCSPTPAPAAAVRGLSDARALPHRRAHCTSRSDSHRRAPAARAGRRWSCGRRRRRRCSPSRGVCPPRSRGGGGTRRGRSAAWRGRSGPSPAAQWGQARGRGERGARADETEKVSASGSPRTRPGESRAAGSPHARHTLSSLRLCDVRVAPPGRRGAYRVARSGRDALAAHGLDHGDEVDHAQGQRVPAKASRRPGPEGAGQAAPLYAVVTLSSSCRHGVSHAAVTPRLRCRAKHIPTAMRRPQPPGRFGRSPEVPLGSGEDVFAHERHEEGGDLDRQHDGEAPLEDPLPQAVPLLAEQGADRDHLADGIVLLDPPARGADRRRSAFGAIEHSSAGGFRTE